MFDALSLKGKVALITGGAGGIGQATVDLAVGRGARVAVADINIEAAQAVAARHGDAALAVHLDLADEASIQACIQRVMAQFGRIDILHNNATAVGKELVAADRGIGDMPTWAWEQLFDVNCRGTMIITREALPHLIATKGSIVMTVSGQGLQGNVVQAGYSATKAALIQMTRSIATAYGRKGVRCNAVAPGLILTETVARDFPQNWRDLIEGETPRGTSGAPEDIAEAVLFLASDAARNITGQTLASDGGVSIHIPGFAGYSKAFGA